MSKAFQLTRVGGVVAVNVNEGKDEQSWKAVAPMLVTSPVRTRVFNDAQLKKPQVPISVIWPLNSTVSRLEQQ